MTVDISGLKYVCEEQCRTEHNILNSISDFITSADSNLNSHDFQTEKPNRCHTSDCHLYCYMAFEVFCDQGGLEITGGKFWVSGFE